MADLRVSGQDTNLLITAGNQVLDTLQNVKSTSVTFEFERKEDEFLSEFAARYDEFFKGAQGEMELQISSPSQFALLSQVKDRAQRRTAAVKISLKTSLTFPSTGKVVRVMLGGLAFANFPLRMPGRTEYATLGLDFATGDVQILTA